MNDKAVNCCITFFVTFNILNWVLITSKLKTIIFIMVVLSGC